MEDPLPAPTDNARPNSLKLQSSAPPERPTAVVQGDAGAIAAEAATKPPIEQRMANLATALRRARVENAEQSAAISDIRAAETVRLEILADALAPVLAQLPEGCDIFDVAVSSGERPRLFIDLIGFVEMERDRRTYRFLQDTRHGRITLRESADIEEMVEAVTDYIAHRLIEREKALAVDFASGGAARVVRGAIEAKATAPASSGRAFQALLFVTEFFGAAAFFGLLAAIATWAYRTYFQG